MAMQAVVVEIERLLQLENIPASPAPEEGVPAQEMHARGYQIGKLLHASKSVFAKQNQAQEPDADEAFIDYAKTTSTINATVYNAVNLFGATLGYMMPPETKVPLNDHLHVRRIFVIMALCFLPLSLLTVGLANSLKPKPNNNNMLLNTVAMMLFTETLYMAPTCGMFAYYLIEGCILYVLLPVVIVSTVVLIMVPLALYKRPFICG